MAGITALSAIMGIVSVKPDRPEELPQDKRVDWLGSFLVTAGLVLIVFVLAVRAQGPTMNMRIGAPRLSNRPFDE